MKNRMRLVTIPNNRKEATQIISEFKAFFGNTRIIKIGQNLKYDLTVFEGAGLTVEGVAFDTMVASYVLDPNRRQHSLDALALTLLGHQMIPYSDVAGKGKSQIIDHHLA